MRSTTIKLTLWAIYTAGVLCPNVYAVNNPSTQLGAINMKQPLSESAKNKAVGETFLLENQKKPGVITLADGLQYKIITAGQGARPKGSDVVSVHYAGTLIDGTEFDSSYKRGTPASFPVGGVIAGWTEALQLMQVGAVWELYIPAALAYGERGAPPSIGPNQTLIFKVELLNVMPR